MENFRQQFLLESVETLENVSQNLRNAKDVSDSFKREIFRTLHTIKGTAQTFGFSTASHLAHELENLLAGGDAADNLFREGIELLIKSLTQYEFEIPSAFKEKLGFTVVQNTPTVSDFNTLSSIIPAQFTAQLSNQEKTVLYTALQNGKNLFCLEIGFDLSNFADELISFREVLNASGEIIATLPSAKFYADGKIGFQILFASRTKSPEIEEIAAANRAEIIFNFLQDNYPNDTRGVLAQVVKHGEETAKKLGKQVDFKIPADEINISAHELKIVFDALLHLVRNAVDHAIETTGKIEVSLQAKEDGLRLIVSDNGRGFDLNKIKAKAVDKHLLSPEGKLTEQETIDLIFLPEFSTKTDVTDVSGRGIGLDAVKYAVEKAGGKITTESRNGKGTTFEIFLPR